ncbi:4-diphosphocytidyl-2C-methyl-D-erythritol kinase [Skermanella stibiiresistens SB22]|uniref:4-diphosphocytidyl-2-C-methyl-D-erythritol kinase n=1 Tax=Skermanella stibiiresistens SB22 TaxID=1385369 RepID=W9H955_9PROT|nr:4-(cytidine 5'-diphospho)-2-C-methyl-D-erythritol kinase [Skermanella stibiiresistens]EWY41192.1 4-diphosphocytidyl-2C-methyl-D-erythritol kinase [Skermanella stibiiresistens SB22]
MTVPDQTVVESAPAKLNLYLHVLGRRADGYHELDSLIAFADIHDTVTARPADGLTLTLDGPFAVALEGEPSDDNLVSRAAVLLAEALDRDMARGGAGAAITLTKRLPVASGIGGGSADAAACLRALARLWGISPADPRLFPLAARLGADVPVCLTSTAAYFGGIGDIIDPAPRLPPCAVVLVNPGTPLSTPSVFKARSGGFSTAARFDGAPLATAADLAAALAGRGNDLTAAATALVPGIGDVLDALAGTPGCLLARLSGSGATCFGLYGDDAEATTAAAGLTVRHPGWWIRAGRLLA